MKKISLLFLLLPHLVFAELILEITQGSEDPYSVAFLNFEGSKKITEQINDVVINDLK